MSNKYREAGVDLEAGYESVRLIKSHVQRTKVLGPEVCPQKPDGGRGLRRPAAVAELRDSTL